MTVDATLMRVSVAMVAVANMLLISPMGHLSAYCPTGSSMRAPRVSRHPPQLRPVRRRNVRTRYIASAA